MDAREPNEPSEDRPEEARAWAWLGALLDSPRRPAALRHALTRLGYSRAQLLRGLASQLGVPPQRLQRPDAHAVAHCRRDRVGASIPVLLGHPDPRLAQVGRRWLAASGIVYEVDPAQVERWLIDDDEIGRMLAPSLAREGLALLGPIALRRVAQTAPEATRALAADWIARITGG